MPTNFLWYAGGTGGLATTAVTVMSTELASLGITSTTTSSVNGASGVFTTSNFAQCIWGDLVLNVGNPGISTVSAGGNVSGWFMTTLDQSTYEPTGAALSRPPDFVIPLPAALIASTTQYKAASLTMIPASNFKIMVQNNLGVAFTGTTAAPTLKIAPYAMQY